MKIFTDTFIWIKALFLAGKAVYKNQLFVLRKAALGDVLWVEPVLRKLATQNRTIFFISDFITLFENFPYPNVSFISNDDKLYKRTAKWLHWLRLRRYIVYLNNSYERQPLQHFLHVYQQKAGLPQENEYPMLYLTAEEKERYRDKKPYAVIHLETTSPMNHRQVYGIEWQNIIAYIKERNITPYFIAKVPETYQLTDYFKLSSVRDMISLIYNAEFFIGIDSGPSHIAASLRIPSVVFFGSVNPWFRHFKELFTGVILPKPCEFAGCYHRLQKDKKRQTCLLVGDAGIPKCCVFTDTVVKNRINDILSDHQGSKTGQ